jgi:hypothetical protein
MIGALRGDSPLDDADDDSVENDEIEEVNDDSDIGAIDNNGGDNRSFEVVVVLGVNEDDILPVGDVLVE